MKIRRLVAAASATSVAMLSAVAPALAATSGPSTPHAATAPATPAAGPAYRSACGVATPTHYTCDALIRTDVVSRATMRPGDTQFGFGPADLWSAYRIGAAAHRKGHGQVVAIVDAHDDPTAAADLRVYRKQFGLPPCTFANGCFRKINEDGSAAKRKLPTPNVGWAEEISLDLDMVSAICPNCRILLVEARHPNPIDLGKAVNTAVRKGAKYVSNSYGGPEISRDRAFDRRYFRHPGVAVTASTGDIGFGPQYPAASRFVTAVGGTALNHASNARGWIETVWGPHSHGATGSGCSTVDSKPRWQKNKGCSKRTLADVSAVADPATGVATYDTFGRDSGFGEAGGTSASSPIIAAMFALAGRPRAGTFPSSYPYKHRKLLNDVRFGRNGSCARTILCHAGPGYDGPTGLGTPRGPAAFRI